jgi:hypothetical protein
MKNMTGIEYAARNTNPSGTAKPHVVIFFETRKAVAPPESKIATKNMSGMTLMMIMCR